MDNTVWTLPDGERGTLESINVSELGHVLAKFKIGAAHINYNIGKVDSILAQNKIFNISKSNEDKA